MSHQLKVMISSTTLDLPTHRKQVMDACLYQDMLPKMMEHLPPSDAEAISASLSLVDEANIYIGVYALRYGHIPTENNPREISLTEMEYDRAVACRIPRLIFLLDKNHTLADFTMDDIDTGESAEKLKDFKKRVESENVVKYFKSPEDLRAHAINGLSELRRKLMPLSHVRVSTVFVAHSSHDWNDFVSPLIERLRAGKLVVLANKYLGTRDRIKPTLELCDLLILCMTPHALRSKAVKTCYEHFIDSNKNIFLLICKEPEPNIPEALTQFPSWRFADMEQLIKLITQYRLTRIQSLLTEYES